MIWLWQFLFQKRHDIDMNYKYIKPKVQYKKLNIIGTTNSKFMKIQFNILNQKQWVHLGRGEEPLKKWFNKTKKSNSNKNQIKTKASIKSQDFHLCLEQTQMQLSRNGIWGILLKIWSYCLISLMDCSNCTLNISKFHDKPNIFTCKSIPLLSSDR